MDMANCISINQNDGYSTKLTCFLACDKPLASILILHGMAEHQKRYYPFANFLTEAGYDVYIYDHRGHGTDKKLSSLGFFAPKNGSDIVVSDAVNISNYLANNNRSTKLILFGHSMGSLIARNALRYFNKYDGVILSGTTHPNKLLTIAGLVISSLIKKFKGPKHKSKFMNNMIFGNRKYTDLCERTAFDWLSRSNPIVGAYIHDPYCGFTCTVALYNDLLRLAYNSTKKSYIRNIKKDLPIYIMSGDKDPVGGYGREVKKLSSIYKKNDIINVITRLYPDCRHELLNEPNKEEVYNHILEWLAKLDHQTALI